MTNMKRVKDRERRFKKMPPERKRMAIARDVLAQLKDNQLTAARGVYLGGEVRDAIGDELCDGDRTKDLRELVLDAADKGATCTACAIGSMFLCTLIRKDEVRVGDYGGSRWMREYMSDFFDIEQLELIEAAFEGAANFAFGHPLAHKAARMFFDMPYDERLKAIMQNILDNKGTFRVEV